MSLVGRGQIVVLEGASLWLLEAARDKAEIQPHAHHAIQVTFALRGKFEIGVHGERLAGPVAAVASDTRHTFTGDGAVAFLFVEPESAPGRALSGELFMRRPWASIAEGPLAAALPRLQQCLVSRGSAAELRRIGQSILGSLPAAQGSALPDHRVRKMMSFVMDHIDASLALPLAADHVRLSQSRARHIFAEQTGLAFKTYVLWKRLERAVALYASGSSLTSAAHHAGFADSAHLSRTFRRTFGLPAAALQLLQA